MTEIKVGERTFFCTGKNDGYEFRATPLNTKRTKFLIVGPLAENCGELNFKNFNGNYEPGIIGPYIIGKIEALLKIDNAVVIFPPLVPLHPPRHRKY
jgi:hypothetical protein